MTDRLYRSRDDRMLAGVAGGVGEHLNTDPTLVRLAWLLLIPLTGFLALVVYVVMAIVVPEEDEVAPYPGIPQAAPGSPGTWQQPMSRAEWRAQRRAARGAAGDTHHWGGAVIVGTILVLAGSWALLQQYVPELNWDRFWPFALLALGVVVLALAFSRRDEVSQTAPNPAAGPVPMQPLPAQPPAMPAGPPIQPAQPMQAPLPPMQPQAGQPGAAR